MKNSEKVLVVITFLTSILIVNLSLKIEELTGWTGHTNVGIVVASYLIGGMAIWWIQLVICRVVDLLLQYKINVKVNINKIKEK